MIFATVIIPQKLPYNLTYLVPAGLEGALYMGARVEIPLQGKAIKTGVVVDILESERANNFYHSMQMRGVVIKEILAVIDSTPAVMPMQVDFMVWVAQYYMCAQGEIMRYFLPKDMIVKGVLDGAEKQYAKSRAIQKVRYFCAGDNSALQTSRTAIAKYFLTHEGKLSYKSLREQGFSSAQISGALKKELITEEWVDEYLQIDSRVDEGGSDGSSVNMPKTIPDIDTHSSDKPLLIYNKDALDLTDCHIYLAHKTLNSGGQMLILDVDSDVNSVAIKASLGGSRCVTLNSKTKPQQHYNIYCRVLSGEPLVILADGKGLGLPFKKLEYIFIANEHKRAMRNENSVRFNSKDCAVMLGHTLGAKVIMESFAPSIESYFNSEVSKYNRVDISSEEKSRRAKITLINKYSVAPNERRVYGNVPQVRYFSKYLLEKMNHSNRTFLFHNRRGYNSFIVCDECGWVLKCSRCNVSMTYHQANNMFICHYCNTKHKPIYECGGCGSKSIKLFGVGSENVEQNIRKYFPQTPIFRVDKDSLSSRGGVEKLIDDIATTPQSIVIGTILAVPFINDIEFDTVGVVDADTLLNIDDFRAEESAYRLLTLLLQRVTNGEMVIHTTDIKRELFKDIERCDYVALYNRELEVRRIFNYPPFSRILTITLKHRDEEIVAKTAEDISKKLRVIPNIEVSNPIIPMVDKVRDEYISTINIKFSRGVSNSIHSKQHIKQLINTIRVKGLRIFYEVDR